MSLLKGAWMVTFLGKMNWPGFVMVLTGSGIIASMLLVVWLNDKNETKQQQNAKDSFFMFELIKGLLGRDICLQIILFK